MAKETPIRRVLVGTSLSQESDTVVRGAAEISRILKAELEVFHSFQPPPAYFVSASGLSEIDPNILTLHRQREEEACRLQLERLNLARDPAISSRVALGGKHRMLLLRAREINADLVIVGAHEKGGLIDLGSTAERVLRRSSCPVLVLHRPLELPLAAVMVLSDLSLTSEACLVQGLGLVHALGGGQDVAGSAFFAMSPGEREGTGLFRAEEMEHLAIQHLDAWAVQAEDATGVRLRSAVRIGEPRPTILAEIEAKEPPLVLLATHGQSGFDRFLLGSTAEMVVRRSGANVLIMPVQKPETPALSLEEDIPQDQVLDEGTSRRVAIAEAIGPTG